METEVSEVLDFASFLDPRFKGTEQYVYGKMKLYSKLLTYAYNVIQLLMIMIPMMPALLILKKYIQQNN